VAIRQSCNWSGPVNKFEPAGRHRFLPVHIKWLNRPVLTGLERLLDRPDRTGSEFTPAGPDRFTFFPTGYNSAIRHGILRRIVNWAILAVTPDYDLFFLSDEFYRQDFPFKDFE
jgi:hypothetical protein